jgi:hypothetical protein
MYLIWDTSASCDFADAVIEVDVVLTGARKCRQKQTDPSVLAYFPTGSVDFRA